MGAVVAIAVGVLASVVAAVIDLPKDSNGWFVFFWIDIIGAGVGGFIAGRRRLDTPLMHGALVGACAYVVIAAFATTITLVSGHAGPAVAQVLFAVLWPTSVSQEQIHSMYSLNSSIGSSKFAAM